MKTKKEKLTPEKIAKIIDPDNTFLDECDEIIRRRFGDEALKWVLEDEN